MMALSPKGQRNTKLWGEMRMLRIHLSWSMGDRREHVLAIGDAVQHAAEFI